MSLRIITNKHMLKYFIILLSLSITSVFAQTNKAHASSHSTGELKKLPIREKAFEPYVQNAPIKDDAIPETFTGKLKIYSNLLGTSSDYVLLNDAGDRIAIIDVSESPKLNSLDRYVDRDVVIQGPAEYNQLKSYYRVFPISINLQ